MQFESKENKAFENVNKFKRDESFHFALAATTNYMY